MSAMKGPYANPNGFGEGDAEYLSLNVMMPSVVASWETPFDGPAYWEIRQAECRDDCGMPGQEAFRLGDLSETHVDERLIPSMRDAGFDGCRNNCIGEIVITFLLEERRPETTPDDVLALWRLAGKVGFGAAWESVTGESWRTFSRAFERDPEYTDDTQSEGIGRPSSGDDVPRRVPPGRDGGSHRLFSRCRVRQPRRSRARGAENDRRATRARTRDAEDHSEMMPSHTGVYR